MSSSKINKKTIARIAAIQTIYQYAIQNFDVDINDVVKNIIIFYQNEKKQGNNNLKISPNIEYLNILVKLVIENLKEIDELIEVNLITKKDLKQMPVLLTALLRVSISELLFLKDVPGKVVISEYTDIANDMLNENEIGFVNSILDKIAKENKKICQTT